MGRDFISLLDDNYVSNEIAAKTGHGVNELRISDIEPRSNQPRKTFDEESLEALSKSIKEYGVLQPIVVRESKLMAGKYEIIAGERRWRASRMAGLVEIPAVIFSGDDLKTAEVSLVENLQREDLNPLEETLAYASLIENFGLTQEQVAEKVGKSRVAITNALRLRELPKEVLELVADGKLSAGHARAILGLKDQEKMLSLANSAIEKDLSVRAVENAVRLLNAEKKPVIIDERITQRSAYMKDLEHRAVQKLGRKVKFQESDKKKVLEISYTDDEDLEALLIAVFGKDFFENN